MFSLLFLIIIIIVAVILYRRGSFNFIIDFFKDIMSCIKTAGKKVWNGGCDSCQPKPMNKRNVGRGYHDNKLGGCDFCKAGGCEFCGGCDFCGTGKTGGCEFCCKDCRLGGNEKVYNKESIITIGMEAYKNCKFIDCVITGSAKFENCKFEGKIIITGDVNADNCNCEGEFITTGNTLINRGKYNTIEQVGGIEIKSAEVDKLVLCGELIGRDSKFNVISMWDESEGCDKENKIKLFNCTYEKVDTPFAGVLEVDGEIKNLENEIEHVNEEINDNIESINKELDDPGFGN